MPKILAPSLIVILSCLFAAITVRADGAPQASGFGFENLKAILLEKHPATIGETLALIAERYPSYFKYHVLSYNSLSLHGANHRHPRAIVFGPSADFIMTFNGAPEQEGYGSIELLSYERETGYQFRDISFIAERNNHSQIFRAGEIEIRTPEFTITKANPNRCLACHDMDQNAPRPTWQPSKLWPGMYGSFDDALFRYLYDADGAPAKRSPGDGLPTASAPLKQGKDTELEGFQEYWRLRDSHSRYRYLPFPNGPDDIPYGKSPGTRFYRQQPNLALTQLFSLQASEQLIKAVGDRPNANHNLALLAAAKCVSQRAPPAPPAVIADMIQKGKTWREAIAKDIAHRLADDYYRMQTDFRYNLVELNPREYTDVDADGGRIYHLAAAIQLAGLNINSFAFNRLRSADFDDGEGGFFALQPLLLEELRKRLALPAPPSCDKIFELLR